MHKAIYTTLIISAFLISGCGTKTVEKQYIDDRYTTFAAAVIVHEGIVNPAQEVSVTKKYKRSECPECKGSGVIVSGDGIHKQTCPYCEVTKGAFGLLDNKCCSHCICEDCQCVYAGECLIKKNGGWPVTVCKDGICEVYYPLDDEFKPYNPFDLLTPEQKKRPEYKKFSSPTKVDQFGNEVTQEKVSQFCPTCK